MKAKMRPITVIIWVIMIVCSLVLASCFFLPYASVDEETREWIEQHPNGTAIEEIGMTNKDAADLSLLEFYNLYSYMKNVSAGRDHDIAVICVVLLVTIAILTSLIVIFSILRLSIPTAVFALIDVLIYYLFAWDIHDRAVVGGQYSYWNFGYAYYMAYVLFVLMFILSIVFLCLRIFEKMEAKRKRKEMTKNMTASYYPQQTYQNGMSWQSNQQFQGYQMNGYQLPYYQTQAYQSPNYQPQGYQGNIYQQPNYQYQGYPVNMYNAPSVQSQGYQANVHQQDNSSGKADNSGVKQPIMYNQ